jgi:hypothetical protein
VHPNVRNGLGLHWRLRRRLPHTSADWGP